jgi:hypothetical protein
MNVPISPDIAKYIASELKIPAVSAIVTITLFDLLSVDPRLLIRNSGSSGKMQGEVAIYNPDRNASQP